MKEVKRCSRCILPESLPSVKLDENGVCNHCKTFEKLFGNWEKEKSRREKELAHLLQRVKRLNRNYDCLIPLSGGKDSTYALYLCDKVYNLKCLCVTFDNGYLSDHAKANIKNALQATNADHLFYTINRNLLLKLYRLFLAKCGNFCNPCMRGIDIASKVTQQHFKIPFIVYGTGRRTDYISFIPELFIHGDALFFRKVIKGEPLEKDVKPMLLNPPQLNTQNVIRLSRLLRIPSPVMQNYVYLFDYIDAPYDTIRNTLKEEMGWTSPKDQFEHMDCTLHEIPDYIHTLKFPELTTKTFYHSGLIRMGEMTMEEAMRIERSELANRRVPPALDPFLREIGMSRDEFESSVRDWRTIYQFRSKMKDVIASIYRRFARH